MKIQYIVFLIFTQICFGQNLKKMESTLRKTIIFPAHLYNRSHEAIIIYNINKIKKKTVEIELIYTSDSTIIEEIKVQVIDIFKKYRIHKSKITLALNLTYIDLAKNTTIYEILFNDLDKLPIYKEYLFVNISEKKKTANTR